MHDSEYWHYLVLLILSLKDKQSRFSVQSRNINLSRHTNKDWVMEKAVWANAEAVWKHWGNFRVAIPHPPANSICLQMPYRVSWICMELWIQCSSMMLVRFSVGFSLSLLLMDQRFTLLKHPKKKVACWSCTKLPSNSHWSKSSG